MPRYCMQGIIKTSLTVPVRHNICLIMISMSTSVLIRYLMTVRGMDIYYRQARKVWADFLARRC